MHIITTESHKMLLQNCDITSPVRLRDFLTSQFELHVRNQETLRLLGFPLEGACVGIRVSESQSHVILDTVITQPDYSVTITMNRKQGDLTNNTTVPSSSW